MLIHSQTFASRPALQNQQSWFFWWLRASFMHRPWFLYPIFLFGIFPCMLYLIYRPFSPRKSFLYPLLFPLLSALLSNIEVFAAVVKWVAAKISCLSCLLFSLFSSPLTLQNLNPSSLCVYWLFCGGFEASLFKSNILYFTSSIPIPFFPIFVIYWTWFI